MKARGWLRGGIALGLLALFGLFCIYYFQPRRPLASIDLGLIGCRELLLEEDGRTVNCWLDPLDPPAQQNIRVLVRGTASMDLTVACTGCQPIKCDAGADSLAAAGQTPKSECYDLRPGSGARQQAVLRLSAHQETQGERTIKITIPPLTQLDAMRVSWRATGLKLAALRKFIPDAQSFLATQPPGEPRDRAQQIYAWIHNDVLRAMREEHVQASESEFAQVRAELEQALATAQQRHWLGSAAAFSQELSWLYSFREGAVAKIDALLDGQPWLALLPSPKINSYRFLIAAALAQQDLRRVERYVGDALADAESLQDKNLFHDIVELRAQHIGQLALTGGEEDVASGLRALESLAAQATDPCDQAYLWGNLGWTELQLWELGWPAARNPIAALERAKELRQKQCPGLDGQALANAWRNLARAFSAQWRTGALDPKRVENEITAIMGALAEMVTAQGQSPMLDEDRIDLLMVEARLHLLQKEPLEALASLRELLAIKALGKLPIQLWLATVQLAEAEESAGQLEPALKTFRQAEAMLVSLQGQVPIYQSHRLMLERYEYSTQRAVELALRLKRPPEALEIIRQASQRALGLTMTPWWAADETRRTAQWSTRAQQQADYLQRRIAYEKDLTQVGSSTPAECQELEIKKSRWLSVMDSIFRDPAPALFSPPPLPKEELLIACAKQREGWVCLGQLNDNIKVVQIPGPLDRTSVESHLFGELVEEIRKATRIRVLASGALAQLVLAEMQFDGQPLGTGRPIRYTLDRPPVTTPTPPHRALLVIKPDASIAGLSVAVAYKQVAPALKALQVTARSVDLMDAPTSWQHGIATSPEVLGDLQNSDVFVYFGHVDPMPCQTQSPLCAQAGGLLAPDHRLTAMCLGQHTALSTADILAARNVPQRAVLLGCASTERSKDAPTEMLGLAQAMALRGSQVLALAQRFKSDEAQEILCALGQEPLDSPDFDMDRFVMNTQRRFYRGERCRALGKWHNPSEHNLSRADITWSALRSYGP